jgi:UDP-N-acetylglucosamine 3-dehydrogenase
VSTPLRTAVIGAGQMGRLHTRVVSECEATELVAIVDDDPATEQLAHAAHAKWLGSTEELPPLDLAIVAVPTAEHMAVTTRLLAAGVPVLVEKPIAATVEEAESLIAAAAAADVQLGVGHVERFNPAVQALQGKLAAGELGRVCQVRAERLSPFPVRVGDTGVAFDLATHDLDVMCELAGTPIRITAEIDRKAHRTHEDLIAATLRFDSGIIGLLEVNWLTPTKVRRLTVTGEGGMFVVDYLNQHLTLYENAHERESWLTLDFFDGVTEGDVTRFAIPREEPLRAQLESFVRAARGEAPATVSGADGLRALRLAFAVVESGLAGHTVVL